METIGLLTIVVLVLAAYRLTRLVVTDEFPFGKLRDRAFGTWLGKLLTCPFCASVWIGGFLATGQALIGNTMGWQIFIGAMALSAVVSALAALVPHLFE